MKLRRPDLTKWNESPYNKVTSRCRESDADTSLFKTY